MAATQNVALTAVSDTMECLAERPHSFIQPTPTLHSALLLLAREFLNPLASDITDAQTQRQRLARQERKRKRSKRDVGSAQNLLRMKRVHVDGFGVDQVWQQARRILDATVNEVEFSVPELLAEQDTTGLEDDLAEGLVEGDLSDSDEDENLTETRLDEDDDLGSDEIMANGVAAEESVGGDDSSEAASLTDHEEEGVETPMSELSDDDALETGEVLVRDKHGLNDGFFSIDDFNKQTQFLENQDARGEPDDGAASDEEDVDWAADPLTASMQPTTLTRPPRNAGGDIDVEEDEDGEDDEDGPTFGNMDLDAPEGASDEENNAESDDADSAGPGDFSNTNNIMYKDFFQAPARAASKSKERRQQVKPLRQELAAEEGAEQDEIERSMARVNRDLFDDEMSEEDEAELAKDGRNASLSSHERRQLALRAEIRRLEAANVAPKDWSLTGEAAASNRPLNSLLEEDLEFERTGKPVPIITAEVNESIEQLIKRRIIAKEFDEVIRRRPTDVVNGADARRGRMREELSDARPTKGLAEEYEQDQLRRTDPNFVDARSESLKKTHGEIEAQWASISAQLDALSNWHYKPRPATVSLDIRVDAPTISMEEARPSAGGEVGGASRLAPQEVYKPGEEGKASGEVLTRGGMPVSREEETREAKKRRRRRDKERGKKANENKALEKTPAAAEAGGAKKARKQDVVAQLKRGGVKVVDGRGQVRDIDGKSVESGSTRHDAGSYKL